MIAAVTDIVDATVISFDAADDGEGIILDFHDQCYHYLLPLALVHFLSYPPSHDPVLSHDVMQALFVTILVLVHVPYPFPFIVVSPAIVLFLAPELILATYLVHVLLLICHAHVKYHALFDTTLFHDHVRVSNPYHCYWQKDNATADVGDGEEVIDAGLGGDVGDYGGKRESEDEHGREDTSLHASGITILKHVKDDVEEKDIFHDLDYDDLYRGLCLALKLIMTFQITDESDLDYHHCRYCLTALFKAANWRLFGH